MIMEKLQYIEPEVRIFQIQTEQIIALSPTYDGMKPEKDEDDW